MYTVSVEKDFCASHFLTNYRGKCENLHGHNYRVIISVSGEKLDNTGMLMDFTVLKKHLNKIMDMLDHTHLNEHPLFQNFNATAENISRVIYEQLEKDVDFGDNYLKSVTVYETPTSWCTFEK